MCNLCESNRKMYLCYKLVQGFRVTCLLTKGRRDYRSRRNRDLPVR